MPARPLELPDRFDRLLEELREVDPLDHDRGDGEVESLIYRAARAGDALHRCDVCRRLIVEVQGTVDHLAGHYGLGDAQRAALEEAIMRTDVEVGDTLSPNYCSYHAQITSE